MYGTLAATPNFIVAPSLQLHYSAAPSTQNHLGAAHSPEYNILVWPPPYSIKL